MGQAGSITAKAVINPLLRVFTQWEEPRILELLVRTRSDLADTFALRFGEFQHLLNRELITFLLAKAIFHEIFDTDKNIIVDKFEVVAVAMLMSKLSTQKKVEYLFDLFDFNNKGYLTRSEAALMIISTVNGSHKADGRPPKPTPLMLESLVKMLWEVYSQKIEGESTGDYFVRRPDFLSFCSNTADVRGYLEFWRGVASQVLLPDDLKWRDPWFPAAQLSITPSIEWIRRGFPPKDYIEWRRRERVGVGFSKLFTHSVTILKNVTKTVTFHGPGLAGSGTIKQGHLSSRWLLNGVAAVLSVPQSLENLFSLTGQEDVGRFCIRIYEGDGWRTVFIDDRFPCTLDGKAAFSICSDASELWLPLYEKAIAKYLLTYCNLGMLGMRPDAPEMAWRWLTGSHVFKAFVKDFDWKSLDSECNGENGVQYILDIIAECSIICFGRSETRTHHRSSLEPAPWEGPPHGRLYPVLGMEIDNGYRLLVIRDAWGKPDVVVDADEVHGHSRLFRVRVEDIPIFYDTIMVGRFLDNLKDAAPELGLQQWSTTTMKLISKGPKEPATLKLTIPDNAFVPRPEGLRVGKKTRSEFGRDGKSIEAEMREAKKERERIEREELLATTMKVTKAVDVAITVSTLQDWGVVGAPRAGPDGIMQAPKLRLRLVPTKKTVENVRQTLRKEHDRDLSNLEAERRRKAAKLKELKDGKGVAEKQPDLNDAAIATATSDSASVSASVERTATVIAASVADGSAVGAKSKLEGQDDKKEEKKAEGKGEGEKPKKKKKGVVEVESPPPLHTRHILPKKVHPGISGRHELKYVPGNDVIWEGWEGLEEDPCPEVWISIERCWISHSVKLYPGEYAIYADVEYTDLAPGWDLHFDRSGELGERPWLESEMTTEEIQGKGADPNKPRKILFQTSSVHKFAVEEADRSIQDYNDGVHMLAVEEEYWPFMAETQAEAATRAMVTKMSELHSEILAVGPVLKQAKAVIKKKGPELTGVKNETARERAMKKAMGDKQNTAAF